MTSAIFEIAQVFLVIIVMGIVVNFLTTLIHELGHAIPSLLFTDDPVTIFVGTYKVEEATIRFSIGRLGFCLVPLFSPAAVGLCYHSKPPLWWQDFIIVISGALMTFFSALFFFLWITQGNFNGIWQIFTIAFLGLSIIQLFSNLIPNSTPLYLEDGKMTFNDGYSMREILRKQFASEGETSIYEYYENENYYEAANYLREWRLHNKITKKMFAIGKKIYLKAKMPDETIGLFSEYVERYPNKLKAHDYFDLGEAYFLKGDFHNSVKYYEEGLYYEPFSQKGFLSLAKVYETYGRTDKANEYYEKARNIGDFRGH